MRRPGSVAEALSPEACPTEAAILAFVAGEVGTGGVEAHLETCDECRRLVSLLADRSGPPSAAPDRGGARAPGAPVAPLFGPGDVVAGKYEIVSEIGRGGMGVVYKANHVTLGQYVALKFLARSLTRDGVAVARFFREARAVAALGSEHVVRVLDAARLPSGEPYLVLEYLEGRDLGAVLRERGPLPIAEAVDYVLGACEALALAHRSGIVHRDVKPSNLFLTVGVDGTPRVKVLDFGVAKVRAAAERTADHTDPASIVGSPRYMPPEQIQRSADVDARADVWALAVSLFEMITGRAPFDGTTLLEVCAAIASKPPPSLRALRPDAPESLAAALERAMAKNRDARTPTIDAFAAAIAPCASGDGAVIVARIQRIATPVTIRVRPSSGEVARPRSSSAGTTTILAKRSAIATLVVIAATGLAMAIAAWRTVGAPQDHPVASAASAEPSPRASASGEAAPVGVASVDPPSASAVPPPKPPLDGSPAASASAPRAHTALPARSAAHAAATAAPRAADSPKEPASKDAPSNPLHRDGLLDRK